MKKQEYNNPYGIALMLGNSLAMVLLYAIISHLKKMGLNSNLIVFLYKSSIFFCIMPFILYKGIGFVKTEKLGLHLARGVVSSVAGLLFFQGMTRVGITNATVLNKIEPIIIMIIGIIYFKDSFSVGKIVATLCSFVGMLCIILKFDGAEEYVFDYGYLFVLAGVLLWSSNSVVVKILGRTESNATQLFYLSLFSVMVTYPPAMMKWDVAFVYGLPIPQISQILSFADFGLSEQHLWFVALASMMHFTHVTCNFKAYRIGEMSIIAPFDYSRLLFAALIEFYLLGKIPSSSAFLGYILILISGIYLVKYEAVKNRKKKSALANVEMPSLDE